MHRKEFIRQCGGACLAFAGLSFLAGCDTAYHVQSPVSNNKVTLAKSSFTYMKKEKLHYRRYVILKADPLEYPIAVYRDANDQYMALLLKCTHQGNELSVNGDILTCSAHGSEFSRNGEVLQGPAEQNLQSFKTISDENNIYIHVE